MGMFDYVHCDMPLPVTPFGSVQGIEFQTKDLMNTLATVIIAKDGTLSVKNGVGAEKFNLDYTPALQKALQDVDSIYFYGFRDEHYVGWIEYRATIVDGKVTHIELIRAE